MIEVREARPEDVTPVADTLARAFLDDPVMTWLMGDREDARLRRLRRFMRGETRHHDRGTGPVLTADGHPGAALWSAPGEWKLSWGDMLRQAPSLVSSIGARLPRALRGFGRIEKHHPREPHWYLAVLGTDPPRQGTGVGRALMAPILDRCDLEGLGAYLESSKAENVPYYERFGFRVTGELGLPGGPAFWPMWRDPQ
jgi:GNAT superfamily N-acetyltransferase